MKQVLQSLRWLYLLTAILLSMQSLAIWHDAEHAFHDHEEQCERYENFANSPALDTATQPYSVAVAPFQLDAIVEPSTLLISKQRNSDAIRAPPQLFS